MNEQKEGTVKFFNKEKGYGFIKELDGTKEYFVHHTGLVQNDRGQSEKIRENDRVFFDIEEGRKGLCAVNVKLA